MGPPLDAATPHEWLDRHLTARYERETHGASTDGAIWFARADFLADGAAVLRREFDRLVAGDLPPQAAATFMASFVGGMLGDAVGFVVAGTGAGVVLDVPALRWRWNAGGWVDRVELAGSFLVARGHPWVDLDGVEVVADARERVDRTVASLVDAATPLVEACHGLTRVGKAGLWNEVGDGLGMAVLYPQVLPVHEDVVEVLHAAVTSPAALWRAHPSLRIATTAIGPVYLGQKGGCCLAYTQPGRGDDPDVVGGDDAAGHDEGHDEGGESDAERAYRERFPEVPGEPHYCSTCSLRDADDCAARQTFWLERTA